VGLPPGAATISSTVAPPPARSITISCTRLAPSRVFRGLGAAAGAVSATGVARSCAALSAGSGAPVAVSGVSPAAPGFDPLDQALGEHRAAENAVSSAAWKPTP
jgi:hypothetical protein